MAKESHHLPEYKFKNDTFSAIRVPSGIPFFVRLDGWRFRKIAEKVDAEKPFDCKFAKCLVESGKALFQTGMNPTLVYVASDELNVLFTSAVPFRGRVEKIDSVLAGIVSSVFSAEIAASFGKQAVCAFDSRVILIPNHEKIIEYLHWRQTDLWRNHNNAYAYWALRRKGMKPSEIAKKLRGLRTKELHELLFRHDINLSKTPSWQRRGILIYKQPYTKTVGTEKAVRWKVTENWDLPLFTSEEGKNTITRILEWAEPKIK